MKKLAAIAALMLFVSMESYSQRILFQTDFETIPLVFPDSLPAGWKKLDVDQNNPVLGWAVNDTNQHFGGDTSVFKPRAHSGKKCLFIFWLAGLGNNNLNDDWVWTDSLRIQTGDSLIFWCLLGSTPNIAPYPDSVQVHICTAQTPSSTILKLQTIKSNDSAGNPLNNNIWKEFKYSLSQFAGQTVYVAWRYYMVVSQSSGLWINIDDLFIGNHSAIGIKQISGEIPRNYELNQNYPNPFNPSTKINFSIPKSSLVKITVFDPLGRVVETIVNQNLKAGYYSATWNAGNLPSGVYFYKILANEFTQTKKMILVK
ncbi:MAG: T9SS type A sorting domain-containing protein [Chlorobi bacterium]|nr:T9SS type A sorting domain-containing protein [Chlorobiota bacterium]MCI0715933.1 T9SS type A sorting domain-containing protein [Chlorobiota bacterium]